MSIPDGAPRDVRSKYADCFPSRIVSGGSMQADSVVYQHHFRGASPGSGLLPNDVPNDAGVGERKLI